MTLIDSPILRAVGVARVSQDKGNPDKRSYTDQQAKMTELCEQQGWSLTMLPAERSVSGSNRLADRPSLLKVVEMIEARLADVLVVGYKDRLDREPAVRDEVIDRTEAVNGMVWTGDAGRQTNATAVDQLNGTMQSAVGRFTKRQAMERSWDNVAAAIADGIFPHTSIPLGYRPDAKRRLLVVESEAKIVVEAFKRRRDGATIEEVRAFLAGRGIARSINGVTKLLGSKVYLGEIHWGKHTPNLSAHPPIVGRALFDDVQALRLPRGRQPKSERLLARLGVLRCATCNGRMVVGSSRGGSYPNYGCPAMPSDCAQRVTISALIAEQKVWAAAYAEAKNTQGRAAAAAEAREAAATADAADARLANLVDMLDGMEDVAGVKAKLSEARAAAETARARAQQLASVGDAIVIDVDHPDLTLEHRRQIIQATIASAKVAPGGTGAGRITVEALK